MYKFEEAIELEIEEIHTSEGKVYEGELKNGIPHGYGMASYRKFYGITNQVEEAFY